MLEAIRVRGITVCFSAGNGHISFPAMMPDLIAAGGVYVVEAQVNGEFKMEASDYASSFDSLIYPGRHVPDVCGLVGRQPRARSFFPVLWALPGALGSFRGFVREECRGFAGCIRTWTRSTSW
ncbi:hypothetical protein AB0H88_17495 [Nonomuraea sp. NPDC050680]|uniref:hypothetical protein n=1 Tax=Nonomuraea sp. NPDC050680 TaxID=3154630 RepID=UPI0033E3FECF